MLRVSITLILVASLLTSTIAGVEATGACGDGWGSPHYWDGTASTYQIFAALGTIRDRPIYLCSETVGASSSASAWAMLAGSGGPTGENQYAQAGFLKLAGWSSPMAFEEYDDGSGASPGWQQYFFGSIWSNGVRHTYKVDYSAVTGKIYIYIDGAQKFSPPWSPDTAWNTPWHAEFFGETFDRGDDVPGTAGARDDFTALAVKHCPTCSWAPPTNTALVSDQSYYKNVWSSQPTSFQIWTQR